MSAASVTVTRNNHATSAGGVPCLIALATITHDSGVQQTVAINEAKIRDAGGPEAQEKYILREVERAMASPQAPQFTFVPKAAKQ